MTLQLGDGLLKFLNVSMSSTQLLQESHKMSLGLTFEFAHEKLKLITFLNLGLLNILHTVQQGWVSGSKRFKRRSYRSGLRHETLVDDVGIFVGGVEERRR